MITNKETKDAMVKETKKAIEKAKMEQEKTTCENCVCLSFTKEEIKTLKKIVKIFKKEGKR